MKRGPNPRSERGFALLLVFLMAAAVAIMLYQQMPRVAFESQREKEQLLIDRGQQYVRGIQLYFVAYKKYPSKIEDLENTNNHRYLRRRYIDPLTGKDEWRLIHVNGAGQLTDSLVQKPPAPAGASGASGASPAPGASGSSGTFGTARTFGTSTTFGNSSTFGSSTSTSTTTNTSTTGASGTSNAPPGPPEVNPMVLRRPSDSPLTPPPNALPSNSTDPPDPNDPKYWPPIALVPATGQNGQPGQVPGQAYPGQPYSGQQYPGQQYPGQQYPGQQIPGQQLPGLPGQQLPGQFPGQQFPGQSSNSGFPGAYQPGLPGQIPDQNQINPQNTNGFGSNGLPVPGQIPGQVPTQSYVQPNQFQPQTGSGLNPPNAAVGMIQSMLTTPRQPSTDSNFGSGIAGGTALAGVATTFKGPSIKVYKDHQKYQEWEFIFDLKQGTPGQQPAPGAQQPTQPGQGQQPGQQPGQQSGSSSGFSLSPSSFGPSTNATPPPQPPPQQQQD